MTYFFTLLAGLINGTDSIDFLQPLLVVMIIKILVKINFSPTEKAAKEKEVETPWSETAPEILHITDATLDASLKDNPSMLVMFYAPCM